MGIIFKDQDGNILDSNGNPEVKSVDGTSGHIDGMEIPLDNPEVTKQLWSVINENTELKQKLYYAELKLDQIKKMLG